MTTLLEILRRAQDLGMFGPGAVETQLAHAEAFVGLVGGLDDHEPFLDLGSGGGLPGLALAMRPGTRGTLLDAQARRVEFLAGAVTALGLGDRITVVTARAEDAARDAVHRGQYGLVIARSFGGPAVTAECAVGFLQAGGRLVVSEPPGGDAERWPEAPLATLGLTPPRLTSAAGASAAIFDHPDATPARWPRRPGNPSKRPLW